MILVDTSVWIDHLRHGSPVLQDLLARSAVLGHSFVLGELALGHLVPRAETLARLRELPQATIALDAEVVDLIATAGLIGTGIGYVDAHLLAATQLQPGCTLWTHDRRLNAVAERLSLAARVLH